MRAAATLAGMRAARDDSLAGPFRRRKWRRGLVLSIGVIWGATLVGWLVPPVVLPLWGWLVGVPLTVLASLMLTLATRNISNSVDAFVDERDREVRDRAVRLAYWTIGGLLCALVGGTYNLVDRRTADGFLTMTTGETSVIVAATVTLILCYLTLPSAIIAWTEPDPPGEEDG